MVGLAQFTGGYNPTTTASFGPTAATTGAGVTSAFPPPWPPSRPATPTARRASFTYLSSTPPVHPAEFHRQGPLVARNVCPT